MPRTIPVANGNLPNGSFLPEDWSTKLNYYFFNEIILDFITNADWGGKQLHKGGVVHIRNQVEIATFKVKYGTPNPTQILTDSKIELKIDQARGFQIMEDTVHNIQSDVNLFNEATKMAAKQMRNDIEQDFLSVIYNDAGGVIPQEALDSTNVLQWILKAGALMHKRKLPNDGKRFVVIPAWAGLQLQMSPIAQAQIAGDDTSIMRKSLSEKGSLGNIGGIEVFVSNNLSRVNGVYNCIAGHPSSMVFAAQFDSIEEFTHPDYFGKYLRGQNIYGYKTNKSEGLIHMPCTVSGEVD
jgi:hypothetical protein